jgi:hypothetical protein
MRAAAEWVEQYRAFWEGQLDVLARFVEPNKRAPPNGSAAFESDVAELFTVRDGRIESFTICFDTAPYPK